MMTDPSFASWIVAIIVVWALWQLLRIASGIETIGSELRRLRQIAEGRQR